MSLSMTFTHRTMRLVRAMLTRKRIITPEHKLGHYFDQTRIRGELVIRLNSRERGFFDVLKRQIVPSDLSTNTKLSAVGSLVDKKKKDGLSFTKYRARVRGAVRSSVLRNLSKLTNRPPNSFDPNKPLGTYLSSPLDRAILLDNMRTDLKALLIAGLPKELFAPSVPLRDVAKGAYLRCIAVG